ncbi:hypothetical protein ACFSX9_10555 [Flavobacterium ardleyense]|uniref:Uncharacterized protein n=1 Tax=Flavobacterium ardleyense TaxID=2038737 RepID=A0ABW5Z9M6_9FLAO
MKKIANYFISLLIVFIFGFLAWNSSEDSVSNPSAVAFSKEVSSKIEQNNFEFNAEGIQKESFSFKAGQSNSRSNEIVRKLTYPFFHTISFFQIELILKNSFEVFFSKKNFIDLFFTTSIIIFPFHYFW